MPWFGIMEVMKRACWTSVIRIAGAAVLAISAVWCAGYDAVSNTTVAVTRTAPREVVLSWWNGATPCHARITAPAEHSVGALDWSRDASEQLIVVWELRARDDAESDVYAQLFRADGEPAWAADGVVVNAFRGRQTAPRVVASPHDGYYVVWQSDSAGVNNENIWCQRLRADGTPAWPAPAAVCTHAGNQVQPVLAADPDGGALIAWVDYRNGNADVFGQRVEADGAPLLTEDGVAIEVAPGDQINVQFLLNGQSGMRIAWDDVRPERHVPVRVETDISRLPIPEPGLGVWLTMGTLSLVRRTTRRVD